MSKQDAYIKKLRAKLDEQEAEIDKLRAKAQSAEADAELELNDQIDAMRARKEEVRERLKEIQSANEDAWEDLKDGAEAAWNDLRSAVEQASSRF